MDRPDARGATFAHWVLLREMIRRELTSRYLGTFSGAAWAFAHPLLQLAIYGYVFTYVFKAKLPESEFGAVGFLPFLAVALWPWGAFAESLNRSATVIADNAGLLGKVAVPRPLLVAAPVIAGFLLQSVGFIAVIGVLWIGGWLTPRWSALAVPALLLCLMVFTLGLAWIIAAIAVFVKDVAQALPQFLMLLFFLTPVLYPASLIPESIRGLSELNPMAMFIGLFRQCLLGTGTYGLVHAVVAVLLALAVAFLGYRMFQRLAHHFEDYL